MDEAEEWHVRIDEVLETLTLQQLFNAASKEIPGAIPDSIDVLTHGDPTEQPLLEANHAPLQAKKERLLKQAHDRYFFERFLVVKIGTSFEVIEGPAPEDEQVYYGHQDEDIAQNWADDQNKQ